MYRNLVAPRVKPWLGLCCAVMMLAGMNPAAAQSHAQHITETATILDQHLDNLYLSVKHRFEANPHFKNDANPRFFKRGYGKYPMPPEYRVPSADLFKTAMKAYCLLLESPAADEVENANHYGIVDYTEDAKFRRFYIYDVAKKEFTHNTWGTHAFKTSNGRYFGLSEIGIDGTRDYGYASMEYSTSTYFSNREGSRLSTLGMAVAHNSTYPSTQFQSEALRMTGVDGNLNSNLLSRAIVMHQWEIFSEQIRMNQNLIPSDGCLMFAKDDFYQGIDHQNVTDILIHTLLGSPILLYHERLNNPALNEKTYQEELKNYAELQVELVEHMKELAEKYGWSQTQTREYSAVFSNLMKTDVYNLIEETHEYFRNASKYIGKTPRSEEKCMEALGI